MDRRILAIVMASAAAALFVLVAVYTWATAAALGLGPLNWRFSLSLLPLVAVPLIGAGLVRRGRPLHAAAVLGTAAVLWLPVPASSVRLLAGGTSGVWTASALLEVAAYGALVVAAVLASQLRGTWPSRVPASALGGLLAGAVVAGSVWPPVVFAEAGTTQWLRPLAVTASEPGDAVMFVLMALVTALVLYAGVSTGGRTGPVILTTAAAVLFIDHLGNLLAVSGNPDATLAPAGWAGLAGTLGLLLVATTRLRDEVRPPPGAVQVTNSDAA
ncbi:MAG TPA: hypothetical protein VK906_13245 [Egicoccus sp.]|nr:hypothetical protein [Egicoccus sp.]HSK24144.1 hypothetical protein [Egicoccus sp.]